MKNTVTVKAYLWVVRSVMENLVFFHYDKGSRAQKVVIDLLKNYTGACSDGWLRGLLVFMSKKKGVLLLGVLGTCQAKIFR
jgi:transposase